MRLRAIRGGRGRSLSSIKRIGSIFAHAHATSESAIDDRSIAMNGDRHACTQCTI